MSIRIGDTVSLVCRDGFNHSVEKTGVVLGKKGIIFKQLAVMTDCRVIQVWEAECIKIVSDPVYVKKSVGVPYLVEIGENEN